jgi:hypothetical protein
MIGNAEKLNDWVRPLHTPTMPPSSEATVPPFLRRKRLCQRTHPNLSHLSLSKLKPNLETQPPKSNVSLPRLSNLLGSEIHGEGVGSKRGVAGFMVSDLLIPGFEQLWEVNLGRPLHITSALDIMFEGPLVLVRSKMSLGDKLFLYLFRECAFVGWESEGS